MKKILIILFRLLNNSESYTSKIWLLKYQNWVIFIFIYSFNSGIFIKKKSNLKIKYQDI